MPYDSSLPADATKAKAAEMRAQFTGLKALIDAVPTITSAFVDAVNTLAAGQPASVTVSIVAGVLHITFNIPRGDTGSTGDPGPQGTPFANAVVDAVNTLSPGSTATVSVTFDGTNVRFTFGLPQGNDGAPGEVTNAALDAAIGAVTANSSANTNGVAVLGINVSDPPMQAEVQAIANKVDELINAMRR
jgi:hypothetical protein